MTIETIRNELKLSRRDMAYYLGLSTHMIKAIELNQRELPFDIAGVVGDLALALLEGKARKPAATNVAPATTQQIRSMKHLLRTYNRRMRNYTLELEKKQELYASATISLGIYQGFITSMESAPGKADPARLKWMKWKIEESKQRIKANNQTAQEILSLEIAGLQLRIARLEVLVSPIP